MNRNRMIYDINEVFDKIQKQEKHIEILQIKNAELKQKLNGDMPNVDLLTLKCGEAFKQNLIEKSFYSFKNASQYDTFEKYFENSVTSSYMPDFMTREELFSILRPEALKRWDTREQGDE